MADLFGAPQGIMAAEEAGQKSLLSGLSALKTMGEINAQPAEASYKGALARLHNAEAADKEAAASASAELTRIQAAVAAENQRSLAETGLPLTADKLDPATGTVRRTDPATQMFDYVAQLKAKGARPDQVMKLELAATQMQQRQAAAAHNAAQTEQQQALAAKAQRQQSGAIASALLANPQTYAQMRLAGTGDPVLDANLPPTYAAAKPLLEHIRNAAIDADKKEELRLRAITAGAAAQSAAATSRVADARVGVLKVRKDMLTEDLEQAKKTGGKYDPAVTALKAERTKADIAHKAALEAARFPGIPVDSKFAEVGKNYTLPDGRRVTLVGKNADGSYRLQAIPGVQPGDYKLAPAATVDEEEED